MNPETGYADVNGTRLYYEVAGSGSPLVFLHGFTLDLRMWDDQFDAVAQHYRVVRYDLRGFGKSSPVDGLPYVHADDLKSLLSELHIEKADIVGFSLGGGVAVDFALDYPDMMRSIVLVDAGLGGFNWSQAWTNQWDELMTCGAQAGPVAANEMWLEHPLFAPAHERPEVAARLKQMVADYSGWRWNHEDSHRSYDPPAIQRLHEIKVPTLIMVGERDLPDFHGIAAALQQVITAAQTVVLPGVGHMSNMESPQQFNDALQTFLEARY